MQGTGRAIERRKARLVIDTSNNKKASKDDGGMGGVERRKWKAKRSVSQNRHDV